MWHCLKNSEVATARACRHLGVWAVMRKAISESWIASVSPQADVRGYTAAIKSCKGAGAWQVASRLQVAIPLEKRHHGQADANQLLQSTQLYDVVRILDPKPVIARLLDVLREHGRQSEAVQILQDMEDVAVTPDATCPCLRHCTWLPRVYGCNVCIARGCSVKQNGFVLPDWQCPKLLPQSLESPSIRNPKPPKAFRMAGPVLVALSFNLKTGSRSGLCRP